MSDPFIADNYIFSRALDSGTLRSILPDRRHDSASIFMYTVVREVRCFRKNRMQKCRGAVDYFVRFSVIYIL